MQATGSSSMHTQAETFSTDQAYLRRVMEMRGLDTAGTQC